jgi:hypothetical protein
LAAKADLASRNISGEADLISFTPVTNPSSGWEWVNAAVNVPPEQKLMSLLVLRGYSRRLVVNMHAYFLQGVSAYYEMFAPSVARMAGLKVAFVKHPLYGNTSQTEYNTSAGLVEARQEGSYWWAGAQASSLYNHWLTHNYCQKPVLLHPIKSGSLVHVSANDPMEAASTFVVGS